LTPENIVNFANEYGLLGQSEKLPLQSGQDGSLESIDVGRAFWGESVQQWQLEINRMSTLLNIWDLASMNNAEELGQIIRWPDGQSITIDIKYSDDEECFSYIANRESGLNIDLLDICPIGDVLHPARYYVCNKVNERLRIGIAPQLLPITRYIYIKLETLISAMYIMFMWEIVGSTRLLLCPSCGLWVGHADERQRYCSNACRQKMYRKRAKQTT
jgi:hypothetical protein